jgi:hypothetical protein
MKRAPKLLPADIEAIDQIRPYRLTDEDLSKLKVTIANFEFLNIGGILVCPQCGQPQKLECQVALDMEVYFFLKFYCLHYGKDSVRLPISVEDSQQPQQ